MNKKMMAEAVELHRQGRHEEAGRKYEQLAIQFPRDPDLLHFRGLLASHRGDQMEAARLIGEAVALRPEETEYYQNLAISHQLAKENQQASVVYNQQGVLLQKRRKLPEAVAAFEKALAQDKHNHWAACNYGAALNEMCAYDRALDVLRKAEKHLKAPQERSSVLSNMGNCYYYLDKVPRALECFDQAIAIYPGNVEAHRNRAVMLLAQGRLKEGFAEYEWRCSEGIPYSETRRSFTQPLWQGQSPEALKGAILVMAEQGFGDTIQFARYVPMLAALGHKVLFEVQPELYNLFAEGWTKHQNIRVIRRQASGKMFNDLPFAALISLMSLPMRFETALDNVPNDTPYLEVAPRRVAQWDKTIPRGDKLNIGLVWQGSFDTPHDRIRSMPAEALEPLLARDDVVFYALQKGKAAEHRFAFGSVVGLDKHLRDFADTAGAIRRLDLVISIDSSVAHLAGTLDCPVWIGMPRVLDWRWMLDRADSPWYRHTRLFRQGKPGNWKGVVADMARALDRLAASRHAA